MGRSRSRADPTGGGLIPDKPATQIGKLTRELHSALLLCAESGMPEADAARRCGIQPATLRKWLVRGNLEDDKPPTPAQRSFALAWHKAIATFMQAHLASINEAAHGWVERTEECGEDQNGPFSKTKTVRKRDWKAAAFMLERRFPADFAPKQRGEEGLAINNYDGGKVVVIHQPPPGRVVEGQAGAGQRVVDPLRPKVHLVPHVTDDTELSKEVGLAGPQPNAYDGSVANQ